MPTAGYRPARYRVELTESARAERRSLAPVPRGKVKDRLEALSAGPTGVSGAKLLDQYQTKWTIPVGNLRIVCEVDSDAGVIVIERIRHRRDAYEGLLPRRRRP